MIEKSKWYLFKEIVFFEKIKRLVYWIILNENICNRK